MVISEIEIDGWEKNLKFSAAHIIPGHDKCSRIHGHTYVLSVYLKGELGQDFMLEDFGELKSKIKALTRELDHRVLLPDSSPLLALEEITEENGGTRIRAYKATVGKRYYVFPLSDTVVLPIQATTAEMLSIYLLDRLLQEYDGQNNLLEVGLKVEEGRGQGAWARKTIGN